MKLMPLVPVESTTRELPIQYIHKCQFQREADRVEVLIPGNKLNNRMKRWILRKCILSRQHPFTKHCIRSTAAINNEINRHIISHRYTIYPFSEFRNVWEMFMAIFMLISLILLPFIIAFHFNHPHEWFQLLLIINVLYILDTLLCFFTGYFDKTSRFVILNRKLIIKKYLKTFFILDFISAIPVQLLFIIMTIYREPEWYWTIFSLIKIVRIRNLVVYSRNISRLYQVPFQTYKIVEMAMILILCIHWATCLQLYVPLIGKKIDWKNPNRSFWLDSTDSNKTTTKIYLMCMSRAIISLSSSSHFWEMKTPEDLMLNMFLTVLGRIGFIYILGTFKFSTAQFLMLMATFHSTKKKIVKSLQQLQEYMQYKELPYSVQHRILTYYAYWSNKSYKRDKLIISNVSPNLRLELLMHSCEKLLKNVEFFKHLPQSALSQIILLLKTEIYLANDVLVQSGTIGDALYYIASGTIAVYSDKGEKICYLEDCSYFGEVALVMEHEKRLSTIIAVETCEVYVLKRVDFLRIIQNYPHLLSQLQKLVIEKLEKTFPNETLHRFEGSIPTDVTIFKSEDLKE